MRAKQTIERVRIGFSIHGVERTLWMSRTDAVRMDQSLIGEKSHFRLKGLDEKHVGFYFTPKEFFAWKRRGFEALFIELSKLGRNYSCKRGGEGFVGSGLSDVVESSDDARVAKRAA